MRQRATEARALRIELMNPRRHDEPGPPEPPTGPLGSDAGSGGRPVPDTWSATAGGAATAPASTGRAPFVVAALLAPLITLTGSAGTTWFETTEREMDTYHMETDDEVFLAAQAFSAALDRHRDTHRYGGGYWVQGTAEAITAALLHDGWTPPPPPPDPEAPTHPDDGT